MSLSTMRTLTQEYTPRDRVYGRAEQYFNITAHGARTTGTQFLPSPRPSALEDNWSAKDELAWDLRL